ncbi:MAG: ATP-binding cassette domain-containing protein [[Clostridium] scindens]
MQVNDVSKSFINFRLQDINLFLDKGQILGYIGPNGAGKTTTIKIITNQYKPDKGAVYVNGYTIECSEIDFKKSIGYIADQFLFPDFLKYIQLKRSWKIFMILLISKCFILIYIVGNFLSIKKLEHFQKE